MTSGMPELGSKISLISKADIRYEGRLFTVDPTECTIALANVRSYGTEDRETQFPISPQNQVYDYILFRGTDIKDIRVVNNVPPMPNDPAIMQMQLPQSQMGQQPFQQPQFPVPVMGHMGAQMGQFGGTYTSMTGLGGLTGAGLAPGGSIGAGASGPLAGGINKAKQASELNMAIPESSSAGDFKDQASVLDMIGGSRSTTPISLHSRKSPTADMGVQAGQKSGGNNSKDGNNRRNNQNRAQRERRDSGKLDQNQMNHENRNQQRTQQQQPQPFHGNNQNRGWVNRGGNMRGIRPRGRGPPMQQAFRQNMQNGKGRPKTTITFESDYDFEQANNKFEELRLELAKLKVGEDVKPEQVNGSGEADKKDDSGNETGAGEHEQEEDEVTVGYDKTKSFFDNISCEAATDRTKGKNRTDWRHERKINSETFGVSARRGGFYNYRGRGGYFNRNNMNNGGGYRGNMGSGGSNGGNNGNNNGYRGGNFRGRNFNNRNYTHQTGGTGIPQQPSINKDQPAGQANPSSSSTAAAVTTPAATASPAAAIAAN